MRKLLAIAFLSLYMFSSTECFELFKLPVLIDHFYNHKEEDKSINLWTFLCMHYAHGDVNDSDRDEDMKLPFKSIDNSSFSAITLIPNNNFDLVTIKLKKEDKVKNNFYRNCFISSSHSSIWQPPKIT